jgi:two-component system, OmpR family, alkaline phosphatase synthesis response regulator PhoP
MPEVEGHTKKVLIVDDEAMIRLLLKQVLDRLTMKNLSVLVAEDGEEALKLIGEERPDLILLDVLLPKVNGYDVCAQVRHIENYNPHIIILTARGNSNDRQRAESIGANGFMTKPFNPSRLMAQLNEIWAQAT